MPTKKEVQESRQTYTSRKEQRDMTPFAGVKFYGVWVGDVKGFSCYLPNSLFSFLFLSALRSLTLRS